MADDIKQEEKDLTKEQNERCFPIAKIIFEKIAEYGVLIGNNKFEEYSNHYKDLVQGIKQIYLNYDLSLNDINFVEKLLLMPLEQINHLIIENVNHALKEATAKKWGKDVDELTYKDIDEYLKS